MKNAVLGCFWVKNDVFGCFWVFLGVLGEVLGRGKIGKKHFLSFF